jgi:DNA ligase D-like protein (predicted 3'-phosphoesterase)
VSAGGYARVMASPPARKRALRIAAGGEIDAEAVRDKARELGLMGWVRPTGELHVDLRLEVGGARRSWIVPKGPSLDPAAKRFAVEAEDDSLGDRDFEGTVGDAGSIVWDRGTYEQGGRVPWPEALERGHAVFVLHGEKLRGGFALQRTRPGAQWLLVKRRDDEALPGSDIVAARPESVISGRTLVDLLGGDGRETPAG